MKGRNNFDKNPEDWESMTKKRRGFFSITPLIPHLIIVAIVFGIYSYIINNGYFPEWTNYIYWGMKIIIGFEVLAAAARTLWGPILALACGAFTLFAIQNYNFNLLTSADGWQLIIISLIGLLVTFIIKL